MAVPLDRFDAVIVIGLGLIAYGFFLVAPPVAYVFLGGVLVGLAVIMGRPPLSRPPSVPKADQ